MVQVDRFDRIVPGFPSRDKANLEIVWGRRGSKRLASILANNLMSTFSREIGL